MAADSTIRMLRYGSPDPLPERRLLRAGPLTLFLEEGGLRYIRYRGQEIVRGIYVAVRDRNWGTVKPHYSDYEVTESDGGFEVRLYAEHRQADIRFEWEGRISGYSDGTIRFACDGEAKTAFLKNRIGFCILHPSELAGRQVEIDTPNGTVAGEFPDLVSPSQPFYSIQAIRHEIEPGMKAELRLDGELFEMEDQRNWTDASYKTYCTPLGLPYPVGMEPGQRVNQQVTLRLLGSIDQEEIGYTRESNQPLRITVQDRAVGAVPQIGMALPPGHRSDPYEVAAMKLLNLSFLRTTIRLNEPDWLEQLACAADTAAKLGVFLELETIGGDDDEGSSMESFMNTIASRGIPVETVFAYPSEGYVSHRELTERITALRDRFGLKFRIGGGSRAYYAELGRSEPALDTLEAVMYTINPQVHAFDVSSIAETVSAHADTVRSARRIIGNLPLSIGPITFKPRLNPVATSAEAAHQAENRANHQDARLHSLFGAGWTLGSIRYLAESHAERVVYFETIGELGVIHRGGKAVNPVYHVLDALGALQGAPMLSTKTEEPLVCEAIGVRASDGGTILFLANYTDEEILVSVQAPFAGGILIRELDEQGLLLNGTLWPRERKLGTPRDENGSFTLNLQPFAVVALKDYAVE